MSYPTHFASDASEGVTLCGIAWEAIVMNERPPTCPECIELHVRATGWSFPLPAVVTELR